MIFHYFYAPHCYDYPTRAADDSAIGAESFSRSRFNQGALTLLGKRDSHHPEKEFLGSPWLAQESGPAFRPTIDASAAIVCKVLGAEGMKESVLDTNVLLRFLVGDQPAQKVVAEQWFHEAEDGKRIIVVTSLVIAEASFVLESFYQQAREAIAEALEVFVSQRWLKVEEREVLQMLWVDYRQGFHFVDSYLAAWAAVRGSEVLTFDRKLGRAR